MGSYEPSDSLLNVEAMERDLGDNENFSETSLFNNTEVFNVCENFVIEQFSCPELNAQFYEPERDADNQLIVEKGLVLGGDCGLSNDKEDVFAIADDFISYQDQHVDSGINQVEPLAGISRRRPDNVDVVTDASEKMSVRNHGDSGICLTESGKGNHYCCLESGKLENAVESSAENVKIPIGTSFLSTQPSEPILHYYHNDSKNSMDPSEETVRDHLVVDEEKQDSSDGGKTDSMVQIQRAEESSCIVQKQLPDIASDCSIEVSTSSESPQISGALTDGTSRQSVSNNQERDVRSSESIWSTLVDSSKLPDTEEQHTIKHDSVFLSTCSDVIPSPPRRSSRRNKCRQKVETQCRKPVNKKVLPADFFLNPVRRTRSCPCKRARSFIWGSLVNLIHVKENEATLKNSTPLIRVENPRSHKRRLGPGNGRRSKTHTDSLIAAKEKCRASDNPTSHTHLKVKIRGHNGKLSTNAVQSDVLDSTVSFPTFVDRCATKPSSSNCTEISETDNGIVHKLEEDLCEKRFTHAHGDLEHQVSDPDTRFLDSLHVDKDLESTVTQDTSVGNKFGNCFRGFSQIRTEAMEEATYKQYSDPGTSPDSEVISLTQDINVGADTVLTSTQAVAPTDTAASSMELMSLRRQKKSTKVKGTADLHGPYAAEKKLLEQNKKKESAKLRLEEKVGRDRDLADNPSLPSKRKDSRKSSNAERYSYESEVDTISGSYKLSGEHVGVKSSEQLVSLGLLDTGKTMGLKSSFGSSLEVRKQRSAGPFSGRNRRKNVCEQQRKEENNRKSVNKKKNKENDSLGKFVHHGESHRETGGGLNLSSGMTEQSELQRPSELIKYETKGIEVPNGPGMPIPNNFVSEDLSKSSAVSSGFEGQPLPLPNAWVRCDDCHKWRCISTELADAIEATNCRWICTENLDKAFADCSIPQEKSNAEINAELEIAEVSGEEDASYAHPVSKGFQGKNLTVPQLAPWRSVQSNLFLHRSRKTQTIDEIMICHCKPPLDGGLGCGDECLNRMLNIECVRGTCPCGDRCSNQQFQKRKYAKLESFRCGKKGYGLQLQESVSSGKFLIEYVGEVLDLHAYEARQRDYACRGQKHFYFMTLNGSEVIDACAKGNLGRFINHSCDPNCRTEKWMVNGEVCIGLFAIRNIKKGEEVTFDYNYVRVFGAAAKKCVCGSSECRGYIGGDPLNNGAVVQGDSDEEYPEPVMINEDGEIEKVTDRVTSDTQSSDVQQLQHIDQMVMSESSIKHLGRSMKEEENTSGSRHAVQPIETTPLKEETIDKSLLDVQPLNMPTQTAVVNKSSSSTQLKVSLLKDDTVSKTLSTTPVLEPSSRVTDTMSKSLPDHTAKSKSDTVEEKPNISKSRSPAKSSRSSSSIKKGKSLSNFLIASKPQVPPNKLKKALVGAANSGPKGVEEKLNEVLDTDGGISKQKDATKGYLKLLILTASSGDNINGAAIQSTRDLSIILDALLKTKKRNVLTDVINKNGLQMLHNIMKQNRKYFNRIPIIRKLLKILEYLAEKEILTLELINSGPPCVGMESFRESIIQLTRHSDMKVQQTARNFRDKWVPPRNLRRNSYSDMNVEQHRSRLSSTYKGWGGHDDSISQTSSFGGNSKRKEDSSGGGRKRKSRWDQPAGKSPHRQKQHDDLPPGFPSPLVPTTATATATSIHRRICSCQVVTGCAEEMYLSELPVSYGVPLFFMDQLGTRQVSPGIPFHPFPPLPPYRRRENTPLRTEHGGESSQRDTCSTSSGGTRPPEEMRCSGGGRRNWNTSGDKRPPRVRSGPYSLLGNVEKKMENRGENINSALYQPKV